jgi:integrase
MGIRKREGRWHYRLVVKGFEYTGNTGLDAIAKNRKEAERIAEAKRQEIISAKPQDDSTIQMPEAAAQFINWCKVEYRAKPNTWERLRVSMAAAVSFWHSSVVRAIDPAQIESFKVHRAQHDAVKDITIRHDMHALSIFFERYAIKQGWCLSNPVAQVRIPSDKEAMRIHVLSADEEASYFARASGFLADVARLMLNQGCRPEEIMSLQQSSIDLKAKTMRIEGGKTRAARRTLNLTEESTAILARRLSVSGKWVFPSPRKPGFHITKLQVAHDAACFDAKVSFVLYDLRHTFATRMIESGCDLPTLAAIMGHNGLRTIFRYVHPQAHSVKLAMDRFEAASQRRKLRLIG